MKSKLGLFLPDRIWETLARTTLMVSANWAWVMFSAAKNCFSRVFIVVDVMVTNVARKNQKSKRVYRSIM